MNAQERAGELRRRVTRTALPYARRLPPETETGLRRLAELSLARRARPVDPTIAAVEPVPTTDAPTAVGATPASDEDGSCPGEGPGERSEPGGPRGDRTRPAEPPAPVERSRARRSGGRGPTVILMYHRIGPDDDPFRLAVTPQRFADQMAALRAVAEPVPLAEVTRPARGPRVAVTFDDGYADNARLALEALEAADVPATVFVTSTMVDSPGTMWPLHLERLFRLGRPRADRLHLAVGGRDLVVPLTGPGERATAMHSVHDHLRDLAPADVARALTAVEAAFEELGPDPDRRMLTRGELLELSGSGLVTIGAHTRRHPQLSRLGPAEQAEEVAGSRSDLEAMIGEPVTQFAYPYGTRVSFDGRSVRAVRRAGFSLACTTIPDPLVRGTSVLRLPRRMVLDWDGPEFGSHLERWLAA